MMRLGSTHSEDFRTWPQQEPHLRNVGTTLVHAEAQKESVYRRDFHHKILPERTKSAKHEFPLDSANVPFTAVSEHQAMFTGAAGRQYVDTMPVTAHAAHAYQDPYISVYGSTFTPEVSKLSRRSRPDPRHKEHIDMPDSRLFVSDYRGNFTQHPTSKYEPNVYPNPPCIPQIFVQEHLQGGPLRPEEIPKGPPPPRHAR